jgi:hypothetical protein
VIVIIIIIVIILIIITSCDWVVRFWRLEGI